MKEEICEHEWYQDTPNFRLCMLCATTEVLNEKNEWVFSDCFVDEDGTKYPWEEDRI